MLSLAGMTIQTAASAQAAGWLPDEGKESWRHTVRMQGSTRTEDVLWWYTGRIYAQVGESEPRHLYNLEGTEIYWYEEQANGEFAVSSRTLTFFRDVQTGAMLRDYKNPYTGKTNTVEANRLGGRHNTYYGPDGWRIVGPGMAKEKDNEPWQLEWHRAEDLAWFTSSRFIREFPQPWLESMTVFCNSDALLDTKQGNLPAHFTSTYLSPWPRWMEMGDHPGHVVWHSSGRKLSSKASVPDEYRQRVEKEYGGVLTAHPDSFG